MALCPLRDDMDGQIRATYLRGGRVDIYRAVICIDSCCHVLHSLPPERVGPQFGTVVDWNVDVALLRHCHLLPALLAATICLRACGQ